MASAVVMKLSLGLAEQPAKLMRIAKAAAKSRMSNFSFKQDINREPISLFPWRWYIVLCSMSQNSSSLDNPVMLLRGPL